MGGGVTQEPERTGVLAGLELLREDVGLCLAEHNMSLSDSKGALVSRVGGLLGPRHGGSYVYVCGPF